MHFWRLAKPWAPAPQGLPAGAWEVSQQSGLCIAQLSCFPHCTLAALSAKRLLLGDGDAFVIVSEEVSR